MASSSLPSDLFLERPEPASSLHGAQAQPSDPDAERNPRRRSSSRNDTDDDTAIDMGSKPQHKIDNLA